MRRRRGARQQLGEDSKKVKGQNTIVKIQSLHGAAEQECSLCVVLP